MVHDHATAGRRRFLAASAASMAIMAAERSVRAAAAAGRTPLQLGLVTYQWGKAMTLPELLDVCARTGFTGVELRSTHAHGVEPGMTATARDEARRRLADSPVKLVGLGSACEYHATDRAVVRRNIDETKAFVDLCAELGGSGVKVRPNGLPKEVPVEKTLEQIGIALREVGDHAAKAGQQIRVEVHGAGTQEIPHMRRIMEVADHPHVVVCWNCNAADLAGDGFDANFTALERWMGTVHIHDLRPGKVDYPWERLFPRLRACTAGGFTGWCLLEDGAVPDDIPAAMRENRGVFDGLAS
jgi:sugar phosphate isomerase/epimerase